MAKNTIINHPPLPQLDRWEICILSIGDLFTGLCMYGDAYIAVVRKFCESEAKHGKLLPAPRKKMLASFQEQLRFIEVGQSKANTSSLPSAEIARTNASQRARRIRTLRANTECTA